MNSYKNRLFHWVGVHNWSLVDVIMKYGLFPYAVYECTHCGIKKYQGTL